MHSVILMIWMCLCKWDCSFSVAQKQFAVPGMMSLKILTSV